MNRYLVIDRAGIVHPAPTFVLSALDPLTPQSILQYAANRQHVIGGASQYDSLNDLARDFDAWRRHPANSQRVAAFDPFAIPSYEDDWIKKAREAPGAKVKLYVIDQSALRSEDRSIR